MTPFAKALLAYHNGDKAAALVISRDDGFTQSVPVATFFDDVNFSALENHALSMCRGHVLDVGAAAGRHTLALQRQCLEVTAMDIEPLCGQIMVQRGVRSVIVADILNWVGGRYDTILMLMNGIGMVGCPERLDRFLTGLPRLLNAGGVLLCDSIDVARTADPIHIAYTQSQIRAGRYSGQQSFSISYAGEIGAPFDWLHISPDVLAAHCSRAGLTFSIAREESDGAYLGCIGR